MKQKSIIFIVLCAAILVSGILTSFGCKRNPKDNKDQDVLNNITFGVIIGIRNNSNFEDEFIQIKELGFSHCQLNVSEYSSGFAKRLREALEKYKVSPTTLICHGPGKYVWNFSEGPSTIGLVPREFREARVEKLHRCIDFCKEVGIPAVHAHLGFIPENPKNVLYLEFVETMKGVGEYALSRGIDIYFETGQETPITLIRAIEDIGTGNLFINCDLANLVMYGKSNSLDGLKILSKYVKEFHAKDGKYPTHPYELGKEVPIPHGKVDFPEVVTYLKQINWKGTITIEHELAEKNYEYFVNTKKYLEKLFLTTK
jgi:L-ribulose-5-phosphate 3-epimerase